MSTPPELLQRLREEIRHVETAGRAALYDNRMLGGGVAALDQLLPEGGYAPGSLVEWLAPAAGCGAELLGLLLARSAAGGTAAQARSNQTTEGAGSRDTPARDPGVIVIADPRRDFYAPAAVRLGIRPDQLVLLQHPREEELYWAIEQALRCPAVAAVYAAADLSSSSRQSFLGSNLAPRWLRRFQLAAEQGGGLGIFVRPIRVASRPTWADLQWRVSLDSAAMNRQPEQLQAFTDGQTQVQEIHLREPRSQEPTVPLLVQLLRCRGRAAGQSLGLQLNLHTGEVHRRAALPAMKAPVVKAPATKPGAPLPSVFQTRLSAG